MSMGKTLSEIAAFLQGSVVGDGAVEIRDIKGLDEAGEGDLTFLANPRYRKKVASTAASAVLVQAPVEGTGKNFIVVKDRPHVDESDLLRGGLRGRQGKDGGDGQKADQGQVLFHVGLLEK